MKIAVIGCGIGGLAVASFLADDGHDITVYDQFESPAPVGSGLVIQPVGLRILEKLGVADLVLAKGARGYNMLGIESNNGRKVLDVSYGPKGGESFGLGIHRASLFDALLRSNQLRNIQITASSRIVGSSVCADGRTLEIEDGTQQGSFDLVIDASGAHSKLSPLKSKLLPYGAIWGTVDWPESSSLQYDQLEQRYSKASNMIGVLPIGSLPESLTGTMPDSNQRKAALFWSMPQQSHDEWLATPLAEWKDQATSMWAEVAPFVNQIESHQQMTMARYSHGQLRKPYADKIVFIGDSAHRASPQLGQGANMALLDAYALAQSLKAFATNNDPLENALPAYASARQKSCDDISGHELGVYAYVPIE